MTITVSKFDVHTRWDELISLVQGGTEVIVSGEGGHAVKLVPVVQRPGEIIFDMHPGSMVLREDFDDPIDEEAFLRGDY